MCLRRRTGGLSLDREESPDWTRGGVLLYGCGQSGGKLALVGGAISKRRWGRKEEPYLSDGSIPEEGRIGL